jgi:hypothetical protein
LSLNDDEVLRWVSIAQHFPLNLIAADKSQKQEILRNAAQLCDTFDIYWSVSSA